MPRPRQLVKDQGELDGADGLEQAEKSGITAPEILFLCLQLDDPALEWLCRQLLGHRDCVSQLFEASKSPTEAPKEEEVDQSKDGGEPESSISLVTTNASAEDDTDAPPPEASGGTRRSCMLTTRVDESKALSERLHDLDALEFSVLTQKAIKERELKIFGPCPNDLIPSVGFECPMNYCREDDANVVIHVLRFGHCGDQCRVAFETEDLSAKAGTKYVRIAHTLTFMPGEHRKCITIEILDDSDWGCTVEFKINLLSEGIEGAHLSPSLTSTRVKIIDNDVFPTNRFAKALKGVTLDAEGWENINSTALLIEYFKMNLKNKIVKKGIAKTMLADCVSNFYFVICMFLDLYMIDYVLCDECSIDSVDSSLAMIVFCRVLPIPLMHWLSYRKSFWKVGGASRHTLQSNILRKYLSYDSASLAEMNASKLILAMTRDSTEIVNNAFCQIPKVVSALARLLLIVLYQTILPVVLGKNSDASTVVQRFLPVCFFCSSMAIFLRIRTPTTIRVLEAQHNAENAMLHQVRQTVLNKRLIEDYRMRGKFVSQFDEKIADNNNCNVAVGAVNSNNEAFPDWCTNFALAFFIPLGGLQVMHGRGGSFGLGVFLNNIAIIKALGAMCTELYEVLLTMQGTFESLRSIVYYMNLPTDIPHRKQQADRNLKLARARLGAIDPDDSIPMDKLCIEMRELHFEYPMKGKIGSGLYPSTVILPQGGFYTLVGPPSEGKGTILKLLGEELLTYFPGFERNTPNGSGDLLIPPHLRVLHVSSEPMFFQDTLLQNLTFGCVAPSDACPERVMGICRNLGIPGEILNTIEENTLKCKWLDLLSSTDLALLHVARALIANAEVLVMHKPALFLNNAMADSLYMYLKEFVEYRGLLLDENSFYRRRPRTCIVSSRRAAGKSSEVADAIFAVTRSTGVRLLHSASSGSATRA